MFLFSFIFTFTDPFLLDCTFFLILHRDNFEGRSVAWLFYIADLVNSVVYYSAVKSYLGIRLSEGLTIQYLFIN